MTIFMAIEIKITPPMKDGGKCSFFPTTIPIPMPRAESSDEENATTANTYIMKFQSTSCKKVNDTPTAIASILVAMASMGMFL